ncbi:MAG TPA: DUF6279 family lipoprotein [Marinobacter sp.]|uniref:DUF6279 family lipoprotein n=1 Tax=Marinobacter sp. TaxID=50741 RepID=UPI0026323D65|nr:DUF6279 family lipoprotein [Marinobacter sp.]HET8800545.1 DUF6279 family lipoprotein [Marinobacter sp.]
MSLQTTIDTTFYHYGRLMLRSLLVFMLWLALSACSSTKIAYQYADWGVVWWVDDYITLTEMQETQLTRDIQKLRQWHCANELPRYQSWLEELEQDMADGNVGIREVRHHQAQLLGFFPPLLRQSSPIAVNLLSSLSDQQVAELARNMADHQEDLEGKYIASTPEATAEARAQRTSERIERWLGDLNEEQQRIVAAWSAKRGNQTSIWLKGRRNWQEALLEALSKRDQPGFAERVSELIVDSETLRGDAYEAMMAESRAAIMVLMHDLIQAGDPTHLAHLKERAAELNNDFAALACSPA